MNKMGVMIDVGSRTVSLMEPVGEGTFQESYLGGLILEVQLV
jgi:hypothetical protein